LLPPPIIAAIPLHGFLQSHHHHTIVFWVFPAYSLFHNPDQGYGTGKSWIGQWSFPGISTDVSPGSVDIALDEKTVMLYNKPQSS
jgi:hypothetical protein